MISRTFHLRTVILFCNLHMHLLTCESKLTPLGPKLCEMICLKTAGCWNYVFLTPDLLCDATGKGKGTHLFNVSRETSKLDVTCESGLKVILTKRGQHKCEFTRGKVQVVQDKHEHRDHHRKERILFMPFWTPTRNMYCYYPANKKFETVALPLKDRYIGVADIPSSEILLYNKARHLKVLQINGRLTEVMDTRIRIIDMATGDMCVYILTGHRTHSRKLKVLERVIKHQENVTWRIQSFPFTIPRCSNIEYDAQISVLYLLTYPEGRVHRLDLQKGTLTVLTDGLSAETIAVDGRNGLMYYSFNAIVKYLNMTDKSKKKAHKLQFNIYGLGYCEGSLFISSKTEDCGLYECGIICTRFKSLPFKSKILIA